MDSAVTRCACGEVVLDPFIGTYNNRSGTHRRSECIPERPTLDYMMDRLGQDGLIVASERERMIDALRDCRAELAETKHRLDEAERLLRHAEFAASDTCGDCPWCGGCVAHEPACDLRAFLASLNAPHRIEGET